MTLAEMRTVVKDIITHNIANLDTTVDHAINTAIEFMTQNVAAIYDEDIWSYTFTSANVSGKHDNYSLPDNTKYVRKVAYVDLSGTETVYRELEPQSPDDMYNYSEVDRNRYGFVTHGGYDYSGANNYNDFRNMNNLSPTSRVDAEGEPRMFYRVNNQLFIHPRPSTTEVDNKIEAFVHLYCAPLSGDSDTNTISINYPYACIHYAAGILWASKFNNLQRAQAEIQLGSSMLQAVANAQEMSKLVNLVTKIV